MQKYWDLRLQALQVNPEAFVTTYEEAIRQENPIKRVESNLTAATSCTFGAFNEISSISWSCYFTNRREKRRINIKGISLRCM